MTLRTLNCGNYGIFLFMGNAGFISSTVLAAQVLRQFLQGIILLLGGLPGFWVLARGFNLSYHNKPFYLL